MVIKQGCVAQAAAIKGTQNLSGICKVRIIGKVGQGIVDNGSGPAVADNPGLYGPIGWEGFVWASTQHSNERAPAQ